MWQALQHYRPLPQLQPLLPLLQRLRPRLTPTPTPTATPTPTPGQTPAAPTNLVATAISSSQIALSWTDNANNETGFQIQRSNNGVNFTLIATVPANVTTYTDNGLTAATTYYYRLRAFNSSGNSAPSNVASATTLPGSPPRLQRPPNSPCLFNSSKARAWA